jgi:hypothetical protein
MKVLILFTNNLFLSLIFFSLTYQNECLNSLKKLQGIYTITYPIRYPKAIEQNLIYAQDFIQLDILTTCILKLTGLHPS